MLGANEAGQVGDGTTLDRLVPVRVAGVVDGARLAAGAGFDSSFEYWGWTCARSSEGLVSCWGENRQGELGDGTTTPRSRPVDVMGLGVVVDVAAGLLDHGCAISSDQQLYCWGGVVSGIPSPPAPLTPEGVSGGWARDVDLGLLSGCALGTDGRVYCWGGNTSGQVGLPSTTTVQSRPIAVSGVSNAMAVAVGANSACALLWDGTVACWGRAESLGAGLGATGAHPDAVVVPGLVDAVAIDALSGTCAIVGVEGRVVCWGDTPEEVEGLTGAVDLAVGGTHRCAALESGSVVCWGGNSHGQLGDGTTDERATPTPVSGLP